MSAAETGQNVANLIAEGLATGAIGAIGAIGGQP